MAKATRQTIDVLIRVIDGKRKDDTPFKKYQVRMALPDNDGNISEHWVNLHFKKTVEGFKKITSNRGWATFYEDSIDQPKKWEVKTQKNGDKDYPKCWIDDDVLAFKAEEMKVEEKPRKKHFDASAFAVGKEEDDSVVESDEDGEEGLNF